MTLIISLLSRHVWEVVRTLDVCDTKQHMSSLSFCWHDWETASTYWGRDTLPTSSIILCWRSWGGSAHVLEGHEMTLFTRSGIPASMSGRQCTRGGALDDAVPASMPGKQGARIGNCKAADELSQISLACPGGSAHALVGRACYTH
jgi:hypothetical protein